MADPHHLEHFMQKVGDWNIWREEHPEITPDLSETWLHGTGRYPVVHTATRYQYGDTIVTIPSVTEPELFKQLDKQHLNRIVQRNSQLTPLFPFNQGTVALEAGMFSMVTNEPIKRLVVIHGFECSTHARKYTITVKPKKQGRISEARVNACFMHCKKSQMPWIY